MFQFKKIKSYSSINDIVKKFYVNVTYTNGSDFVLYTIKYVQINKKEAKYHYVDVLCLKKKLGTLTFTFFYYIY